MRISGKYGSPRLTAQWSRRTFTLIAWIKRRHLPLLLLGGGGLGTAGRQNPPTVLALGGSNEFLVLVYVGRKQAEVRCRHRGRRAFRRCDRHSLAARRSCAKSSH